MKASFFSALAVILTTFPAFASNRSQVQVQTFEADPNIGYEQQLDDKLDFVGTVGGVEVSANRGLVNTTFLGSAKVVLDNDAHAFRLQSSLSLNTTADSTPTGNRTLSSNVHMSVSAEQRDRIKITAGHEYTNATVHLVFKMTGGPISASGTGPHASSSITAGVYMTIADVPQVNESGTQANDAGFVTGTIGKFDGSAQTFEVTIPIANLGLTPVYKQIQMSLSMNGIATEYYAAGCQGNYTSAGVVLDQVSVTTGNNNVPVPDARIVGDSLFAYLGEAFDGQGAYWAALKSDEDLFWDLFRFFVGKLSAQDLIASASFAISIDGSKFSGKANVEGLGPVSFGASKATELHLRRRGKPDLVLSMEMQSTNGVITVPGLVTEVGTSRTWHFVAARAIYTSAKNPTAPLINVPPELQKNFTVLFEPKTPAEQGISANLFPQGYGWAKLTVSKTGAVKLNGKLADGATVSASAPLLQGPQWPFAAALYGKRGSIGGIVNFRETANLSDLDALDISWTRPKDVPKATTVFYPAGWPAGIKVNLIGSQYVVPDRTTNQSVLPGLAAPSLTGNANIKLSTGNLAPTPLNKAVNVDPKSKLTVVTAAEDKLAATIASASGKLTGSFVHNATGKKAAFAGVVFQKQKKAAGYFLSPTESGSAELKSVP